MKDMKKKRTFIAADGVSDFIDVIKNYFKTNDLREAAIRIGRNYKFVYKIIMKARSRMEAIENEKRIRLSRCKGLVR